MVKRMTAFVSLISTLLIVYPVYSSQTSIRLSSWINLRSDSAGTVRDLIRSEVDKREGFSSSREEKANITAVEQEKDAEDSAYKKEIDAANREFNRAKKKRDDMTAKFQAVSIDFEDQQKNINALKEGIENLDSQIARYNQDIKTQQGSLKKWLQTEKQGEALVAVIFTRGFRDSAHALEGAADKESSPFMAKYMGTYIQSYSKVIDSVLTADFIRAVEEGTAKWNNEEPLRWELMKNSKGTTYLRIKRYEMFPFQSPKAGRVKPGTAKNIHAAVISTRKELNDFMAANGYTPGSYDLAAADKLIRETMQANAAADASLKEQVKSFHDWIGSLQDKIRAARLEKENQLSLLKRKEEPFKKTGQQKDELLTQKQEADRLFEASQKALHERRRIRETIIIKTALATARGSQTPAEASAEAIIDKLAEVKNDAKIQHSTSTTEVANFQVTSESSLQTITDARITAARLLSFINEGDAVRVKMAFRIRTVLDEIAQAPQDGPPGGKLASQPEPKPPKDKPLSSYLPSILKGKPKDDKPADETPAIKQETVTPSPEKKAPPKRNPDALAVKEVRNVLFELIAAKYADDCLNVYIDLTNLEESSDRQVALYDETYRWARSRLTDAAGKEYEVSRVVFWKGKNKLTMYDAGRRGAFLEGQTKQTAQLTFKNAPKNMKSVAKLTLYPFVYFRKMFSWSWEESHFAFQNFRVSR